MSPLLICQRDSYLKEGTSQVLSCEAVPPSAARAEQEYALTFQDSVLYPEGGGQPWDLGTCDGQEVQRVESISEGEGGGDSGRVRVVLKASVPVGEMVTCRVDWARRFDFMQQHTAQHLFSAVMQELYQADTVKWELGSKTVAVDFTLPEGISVQLEEVEERVNLYIRENRAVSSRVVKRDEVGTVEMLRGGLKGAATSFENIRIVTIAGLDANPCGGTHVNSTGELQLFTIVSSETDRGSLRLRFLSGGRALTSMRLLLGRESRLASLLSVPPSDHAEVVSALLQDKKDASKSAKSTEGELALLFASSIIHTWRDKVARNQAGSEGNIGAGGVVVLHRPGASLAFLQAAAEHMLRTTDGDGDVPRAVFLSGCPPQPPNKAQSKGNKKATSKKTGTGVNSLTDYYFSSLAGNVSSEGSRVTDCEGGVFVLYGDVSSVSAVGQHVCSMIGGRGGGRPGRLQGTATKLSNLVEVEALLQAHYGSSDEKYTTH